MEELLELGEPKTTKEVAKRKLAKILTLFHGEEKKFKEIVIDESISSLQFNEIDFNNKEDLKNALIPYQNAILKLFGRFGNTSNRDNNIYRRIEIEDEEKFKYSIESNQDVFEYRKYKGDCKIIKVKKSKILINKACYHKEDRIVHEHFHRLSDKGYKDSSLWTTCDGKVYLRGVCESYFDSEGEPVEVKYEALNEGITELFTNDVIGLVKKYPKNMVTHYNTSFAPYYNLNLIVAQELANIFGKREIEDAYFITDITKIKKMINKRLGDKTFDGFCKALDNKETQFEIVYEYLDKIKKVFMR